MVFTDHVFGTGIIAFPWREEIQEGVSYPPTSKGKSKGECANVEGSLKPSQVIFFWVTKEKRELQE